MRLSESLVGLDLTETEPPSRSDPSRGWIIAPAIVAAVWASIFATVCAISIAFAPDVSSNSPYMEPAWPTQAMFPLGEQAALISFFIRVPLYFVPAIGSLIASVPVFLIAFALGVSHVAIVTGGVVGIRALARR